jgi:general secretion pathway protein D
LSAKRTHTLISIAVTQIALACALPTACAAAPEASTAVPAARPTIQKPLTREDADLMLREARGNIEEGRLDEAEKILTRVENAHVNYSVFHVGPNPASVRRELTRARRLAGAPGKPAVQASVPGAKSFLPFARNGSTKAAATQDPFAARNQMTDQKTATTSSPPPAGSLAQAAPGRGLDSVSVPEGAAARSPLSPAGRSVQVSSNDIVSSNDKANDRPAAPSGVTYPVTQAAAQDNPFGAAPPANAAKTSSAQDRYATPSSPNVPMPAGASTQQTAAPDAPGLMPPQNAVVDRAASQLPARETSPKKQAQTDLAGARKALAAGNIEQAEKLTRAATAAGVPESEYLPDEDRPSLVAWDIARAKQSSPAQKNAAAPASIERLPATASVPARYETPNRYDVQPAAPANTALAPSAKLSENQPAAYRSADNSARPSQPALTPPPASNRVTSVPSADAPAMQPVADGPRMMAAAPAGAPLGSQLRIASATTLPSENLPPPSDAAAAQPLAGAAEPPLVEATPVAPAAPATEAKASLIDTADENLQALARQLSTEVGKRQTEALKLQEKDPERAVTILHEAQKLVKDSKLPESSQRELLSRIEITLAKCEKYVKDNRAEIDLDKQNEAVLSERDRDREMKLKVQQKMAELVDEFNRLRDEQRYAEMEIIARRLIELAPDEPVAQQVWLNAKFIRREMMNRQLADARESGHWEQLNAVEEAAVNDVAADGHEMAIDQKYWTDFVKNRQGSKDRIQRRTEREMEIERRLKTPVLLRYQETPLSEVMSGLSELTGVNIHLDPRGLTQEGINSDSPVTINLSKEISLKSALNLILEPLHLSYVIHDEVLKITSEQLRDGEIYAWTYNVADLVTPIPNFVPSSNIGLQGLINEAQASASQGRMGASTNGPTVLVNGRGQKDAAASGDVLAQQFNAAPTSGMSPSTVPIGAGPGGMGAGANADFDSLIDLIVSTVSTDTWAENGGGEAEIRPFPTNLSLVISQTQAVHEEIADLLQQLRRLQDLQVTIEVRFIRLNDSFFERIGIDFDLDVNDSGVNAANRGQFQPDDPEGNSNTVGLLQPAGTNVFPNFTTDLDIPFRQDSFNLTQVVPFGGPVGGGLNFGFAILSDLEAYFLIEAAQGDRRTNVLNAPKVTLFNGQQAFVADATQRPFVVGVIPVVGEFAAAQQPVIVVLNEGTMMTIQAVVSDDRRYVRMTIVPFFTQIGDVDEFTFEGSSSTTSSSASADDDDDGKNESKEESKAESRSGVTVQLPSFSFVSVVTTVSVPDGGTVLLGGIKRLSEGRNEFGVPLLSKVPYINRLFRNVAIGRETDSLMMMVTPRIIIQEEEEERLGIAVP